MFADDDKITARETFFFIVASMIEVGTLTGAKRLAGEVGPDLWLAHTLGYLFALPGIFIIVKLSQRFPRHGFGEYSRIIAGPALGWILSAILVAYWLFVSGRVLRSISDLVRGTLLDRTPFGVIVLSYLAAATYISWYGIEPLARLSILLMISVVPAIVILFLAALPLVRPEHFLPFLAQGPWPVLKSGIKQIADWEEMSLFFILIPFMNRPEKAAKAAFFGSFVVWVFVLYVMSLSVGVTGSDFAKTLLAPPIAALDASEIPGAFIERLGVTFTGLWVAIAFPTIASLLLAMAVVVSQMFGLKDHRLLILPLAGLTSVVALLPLNTVELATFFEFLTPFGIVVLLAIPLLLYVTAIIRGVKGG